MNLKIGWSYTSIPGVYVAEAQETEYPLPAGVIWYKFLYRSTVIEILGCYVPEFYRRKGVMTFLQEQLFVGYPKVVKLMTEAGSKDGGMAFMKAKGWKKNDKIWELSRPVKGN